MLTILRSKSQGMDVSKYLEVVVSIRDDKNNSFADMPDLVFSIKTYSVIQKPENPQILEPINMFFETLDLTAHKVLYRMYATCYQAIQNCDADNRREMQDFIQQEIFDKTRQVDVSDRLIAFCRAGTFHYPDLSEIGKEAHHTPALSFHEIDYEEMTGLSLFCKLLVPILGEFIYRLEFLKIPQVRQMAFDMVEPAIEDSGFNRIYTKLANKVRHTVREERLGKEKARFGNTKTSYLLTHHGFDDMAFENLMLGEVVVKRLATYDCFSATDAKPSNIVVYIDYAIKRNVTNTITTMSGSVGTTPLSDLQEKASDEEDNMSVLDHISSVSRKTPDVAIMIALTAELVEIGRLVEQIKIPHEVFHNAWNWYLHNSFIVSPLCEALMPSFVGNRFGGPKCLEEIPLPTYQKLVVLLQYFLIDKGFVDLAALLSSHSTNVPIQGINPVSLSIATNYRNQHEYRLCENLFRGYLDKPVKDLTKRAKKGAVETYRVDFARHVEMLVNWITRLPHTENMAPVLWDFAGRELRPIQGEDVLYDENIVRDISKFYTMMHDETRPF